MPRPYYNNINKDISLCNIYIGRICLILEIIPIDFDILDVICSI